MAKQRHVIVGGGTAGLNAILAIREHDRGASEIALVSAERPYARMVLPYYLGRSIAESHVFTLPPARLAQLGVTDHIGRRAVSLDAAANTLTLDDGTVVAYDDLLIATGSSAVSISWRHFHASNRSRADELTSHRLARAIAPKTSAMRRRRSENLEAMVV